MASLYEERILKNINNSISIWHILRLESDTYYWINADYLHKARCTKPKAKGNECFPVDWFFIINFNNPRDRVKINKGRHYPL